MPVQPSLPQPGLFAQGVGEHFHVEFRLRPAASAETGGRSNRTGLIREAIAEARRVATWLPGPNVTWGFAPDLWRRLQPEGIPSSAQAFAGLIGKDDTSAPATQYDIWAWCSGRSSDSVAATAADITAALAPVADLTQQLGAFTAADSRDPTGFIDGTENPAPDEAYEVALFPAGTPGGGGSVVLIQKWVHDLAAFNRLTQPEQEGVIGRTKELSVQLPAGVIPDSSHVSRNTVTDDRGEERHIYRRNTPFIEADSTGTLFIGATNDPELMDTMLARMFGTSGDDLIDDLIRFSTPVTGSYYFVPSMSALAAVFGSLSGDD